MAMIVLHTLLAMDATTIGTFVLAGIVLNLTPGADVMFASACGLAGGWRVGVAAAAGVALGAVLHVGLASFGLSAALLAHPNAYDAIRWAGGAYLLWLAWAAWHAPAPQAGVAAIGLGRAVWRGFTTNALNPKVALFVMAFLPQFANPAIGPVWPQVLALGVLFITTGFFITAAYGAAAGIFGQALGRAAQWLGKISAVVFAGLAARLVLD